MHMHKTKDEVTGTAGRAHPICQAAAPPARSQLHCREMGVECNWVNRDWVNRDWVAIQRHCECASPNHGENSVKHGLGQQRNLPTVLFPVGSSDHPPTPVRLSLYKEMSDLQDHLSCLCVSETVLVSQVNLPDKKCKSICLFSLHCASTQNMFSGIKRRIGRLHKGCGGGGRG